VTPRIGIREYLTSTAGRALTALGQAVDASGIDGGLVELVKVRTSQINGCAYCIDMHTKDARAAGETEQEQRLYALAAWREAPFFLPSEACRARVAEAVTLIANAQVPDEVYERATRYFEEAQIVALTLAVVATNAWNRLVTSFRVPVGTYQPLAYARRRQGS
jgi:AhpD family alkylhydroperoxidase